MIFIEQYKFKIYMDTTLRRNLEKDFRFKILKLDALFQLPERIVWPIAAQAPSPNNTITFCWKASYAAGKFATVITRHATFIVTDDILPSPTNGLQSIRGQCAIAEDAALNIIEKVANEKVTAVAQGSGTANEIAYVLWMLIAQYETAIEKHIENEINRLVIDESTPTENDITMACQTLLSFNNKRTTEFYSSHPYVIGKYLISVFQIFELAKKLYINNMKALSILKN